MTKQWTCEICGQKGEPNQPASSCCCGRPTTPASDDIITFSMGVYSLKLCIACRDRLSDEDLRKKIRAKVSGSVPESKK